jgi:hypothetical protein
MNIWKFFKSSKSEQAKPVERGNDAVTEPHLFYHEDDFLQVEFLPSDNFFELQKRNDEINGFASDKFDGYGFTEMAIREAESIPLLSLKIPHIELDAILEKLQTNRYDIVTTGYGQNYREIDHGTIGYGIDYSAIYYKKEGDFVKHIWLTATHALNEELLVNVLLELGTKYNLLLQDWNRCETYVMRDINQVRGYFSN